MKASVPPSGEKAGYISSEDSGGEVSFCFSPSSTETRKILYRSCGEVRSASARKLPSGDQANLQTDGACLDRFGSVWPNLRSAPPRAGTIKMPFSVAER